MQAVRSRLVIVAKGIRAHFALGLTGLALAAAAALAAGVFGVTSVQQPAGNVMPAAAAAVSGRVAQPGAGPPVLTYYLVGSKEQQAMLYSLEDQLWNREWLQQSKIEVLLARDRHEEAAAYREIAAARMRSVTTRVVVEDLRQQ